jgi:hypothetical protein
VWWARRQWSRGTAVPYAVGEFRDAWAQYPVLVRQFHSEFNAGIVLTQVPPAADVWVSWECDVGHRFIATPAEQRARPGRERRRSSWCPDCQAMAQPRPWLTQPDGWPESVPTPQRIERTSGPQTLPSGIRSRAPGVPWARAAADRVSAEPARRDRRPKLVQICGTTPRVPDGTPFHSSCAPPPASAVESELRAWLTETVDLDLTNNAVKLARPFFDHVEAWPDLVLPELRVAIEYDSTGRHGLEHVGRREDVDRRKDRALRSVGWEVVRIRTGRLQPLGPYDLVVNGIGRSTRTALLDRLREIRGPLFVDAYVR